MRTILSLILSLLLCFVIAGCEREGEPLIDDTEDSYFDETGSSANEDSTPDKPKLNIKDLVAKNVEVTGTYSNYSFTFNIKSTLKSVLPNHKIQYGIGHYTTTPEEEINISIEDEAYYFSSFKDGDTEYVTFKNPFWLYYTFCSNDKDRWTKSAMYYASYLALIDKGSLNWSDDEKELMNKLQGILNEYERMAYNYYEPGVAVVVDNKAYLVAQFRIPK